MHRKWLTISGIVILSAIASAAAGRLLRGRALAAEAASVASLKAQLGQAQAIRAQKQQAARDLQTIAAKLDSYADRLPDDPDAGSLLQPLGQKMSAAKVREQEIIARPVVADRSIARMPVLLKFRGTFADAFELARHLEGSPRLTRVEKVRLDRHSDTELPTVEIEFSAYSRTPEDSGLWNAKP